MSATRQTPPPSDASSPTASSTTPTAVPAFCLKSRAPCPSLPPRVTPTYSTPVAAPPRNGTPKPAPANPPSSGSSTPKKIYIEINPRDAKREGIRPNSQVQVQSQRGKIVARAYLTQSVPPGQVFIPMHYAETNQLTLAHYDPYSRQPSYKNCAVRIRPASESPVTT